VIGRLTGDIPRERVESIESVGDTIFITGKNGNGFIVPQRAFGASDAREEFLRCAEAWWKRANGVVAA